MSREVCGICWCPYDDNGACGCKPQTGATMKRDDIIRMAQEASLCDANGEDDDSVNIVRQLERFLALAIAAKDAEHQQTLALQQRSYEREIQLEVEAEREACAKVCEGGSFLHDDAPDARFGKACASAIRARSKE